MDFYIVSLNEVVDVRLMLSWCLVISIQTSYQNWCEQTLEEVNIVNQHIAQINMNALKTVPKGDAYDLIVMDCYAATKLFKKVKRII